MAKYWTHLKEHPDEVEKHKITDEELTFLKHLQHEMNTQDTVGQADPRYWVIRDYERIYGDDLNNADGFSIYDTNSCSTIIETDYLDVDEVVKKILKAFEDDEYELSEDQIENIKLAYDMTSLKEMLGEIDEYDIRFFEYQEVPVDNGAFLTHEAAVHHLKNNEHHYSENAHTYAKTAWRSTEDLLWKILQTVDFDQIN